MWELRTAVRAKFVRSCSTLAELHDLLPCGQDKTRVIYRDDLVLVRPPLAALDDPEVRVVQRRNPLAEKGFRPSHLLRELAAAEGWRLRRLDHALGDDADSEVPPCRLEDGLGLGGQPLHGSCQELLEEQASVEVVDRSRDDPAVLGAVPLELV